MDAERKFLYCVKAKVVGLYMYRLVCNLSLNIYVFGIHFMSFAKKPKTSRTSLSLLNATTISSSISPAVQHLVVYWALMQMVRRSSSPNLS